MDIRSGNSEEIIYLHCECGCDYMTIFKWVNEEEDFVFDLDTPYQLSLWKRVKFAVEYIRGKRWFGISVTKDQVEQLRDSLTILLELPSEPERWKERRKKLEELYLVPEKMEDIE